MQLEIEIFKFITVLRQAFFENKYLNKTVNVPIGRSCHSTIHLKYFNLRKCSYPMDWIAPFRNEENFEQRINWLINGFDRFFDLKDIEIQTDGTIVNNFSRLRFPHEHIIEINQDLRGVLGKYKRRAMRLMKNLEKAKNINLFYMQNTFDQINSTNQTLDDALIKTSMELLRKHYPNKKINLFIFEHNSQIENGDFIKKVVVEFENIKAIRFISNHCYEKEHNKCILSIYNIMKNELKLI